MFNLSNLTLGNRVIIFCLLILIVLSNFVLRSIVPEIFPEYYLYIVISIIVFYILLKIDFEVFTAFSGYLYITSVFFLILTLVLGQVTRGSVRWIPLGAITLQPSEVFRAFILLFLAKYATEKELNGKRFIKLIFFFGLPFFLILIQPSLGVAIITGIGFLGILFASSMNKRLLLYAFIIALFSIPLGWFLLAPYQKERITAFMNPYSDPLGSGYNSIQSTISVGSGRVFGRGLGQGVQTHLAYLPEKHSDFIFAAISEELGFLGASLTLISFAVMIFVLVRIIENAQDPSARSFVTGVFFIFLAQTFIHIGMNMGLVPITGLPLPFVSAGGSDLLGSFISLSIAMKAQKYI